MKAPNSRDRNSVSVSLGHHKKKKLAKLLVMVRSITLNSTLGYFWGQFIPVLLQVLWELRWLMAMVCQAAVFFFGGGAEKSPKGDTAQNFARKSPFFLKSIRQTASLFNERVAACMATGYIFNAPG
jgi:hypothetical protein